MLQINMADVMNVIGSLTPYLIAIGVLFALALIITFAVNKKTVKEVATRKIVHSESWLVALVGIVVAVSMMLTGPLSTLLNNATTTKYTLSDATVSKANELAKEVQSEAITMLKNDDSNLPLSNKKVNVFGWGSTNPVYGGTGSGSMSDQYETVSMLDGMKQAGIETNSELTKLYTDYRKDRPMVAMWSQDWTLPEVPAKQYSDKLISDAKDFSDEAVITITRVGGEGADLPTNMKAKGITYNNNSKDYEDFKDGEHFLQLSQTERDMIDLVTKNFKKVTLVYNGANAFQFDFLSQYPQIKSVLWCPPAGQTGFSALGEVLAGDVNPSGKTSDTFVKDLTKTAVFNNTDGTAAGNASSVGTNGKFTYDNADDLAASYMGFSGDKVTVTPTFVNYVEGIYVGYKFYETAADEGLINYDDTVMFPFGYGLSYTTFKQEMGKVSYKNGKISFDVTVTNTGDKAGKDVVEVYYNPPYTDGGIEKASANLLDFAKTSELAPGESETIDFTIPVEDLASYDYKNNGCYVLEAGDYIISTNSDSHNVLDSKTYTVASDIVYNESNKRESDAVAATNQFDFAEGEITYLSRADGFANYAEATAAPADYNMSDEVKAVFDNAHTYTEVNYEKDDDPNAEDITTGAKNGLKLADLRGVDYNDSKWDDLLDEMSIDDLQQTIGFGGYQTAAVDSIGKVRTNDCDGPASINNNFTGVGSVGFPAATLIGMTWSKDLAHDFGDSIGKMANEMNTSGWYGPAMNIHRTAFAGRNFEYYSEDGVLSGAMAANAIAGAQEHGVYAYMKHFALNDQEGNRTSMLATWSNEQAIREIYLKPFEMSVKDADCHAVMSSFNYIGSRWAGGCKELLQNVLRGEWGFLGFVETDYFGVYGYMTADQGVRNGSDLMLCTTGNDFNKMTVLTNSSKQAMRTSAKNILYTVVNSRAYEAENLNPGMAKWKVILIGADVVAALLIVGLEYTAIKNYKKRKEEEEEV